MPYDAARESGREKKQPLNDARVRAAKPGEKPYKMFDTGGLFLLVAKTGLRSWRMKYQFDGAEKLITFGTYPDVSIKAARDRRDEARARINRGEDPSGEKKRAREAREAERRQLAKGETFEAAARRWHDMQRGRWAPVHANDVITSLERDIFPHLGNTPVTAIDTPAVLGVLRKVEARGSIETAKRLRQRISAVFALLTGEGAVPGDPAAIAAKSLKPLPKAKKQPSITDPEQARRVLIDAEASGASPVTKLASRLLALTAVRPSVVRGVTWEEFEGIDWTGETYGPFLPLWRVPAARMKLVLDKKDEELFDHLVPLPWQAVEALIAIRRLTGRGKLVFPGQRHAHRPLSENAIGYLYNRVGYHGRHVPHGWRASFSTTMKARARKAKRYEDLETIELMLAHEPENKVAAAYDRHEHMERRRELAQEWADLLFGDVMRPANELLEGPRR